MRERYAIEVRIARALRDRGRCVRRARRPVPSRCGTSCANHPHPYHDAAGRRELRLLARELALTSCRSLVEGRRPRPARATARLGAKTCSPRTAGRSLGPGRRRGRRCTRPAERAVAPLSDAIVCVSNHDLKLAPDRRSAARRAARDPQRVDAPAVLPYRRPPGEPPRARLHRPLAPPKDLITLLDALAQPGCESWDLRCLRRRPRSRVRSRHRDELNLADRVTLLGNRDDVPAQLTDCDAFALIATGRPPYSILEAMRRRPPRCRDGRRGIADLVAPGSRLSSCRRATLPPRAACSPPGPRTPRSFPCSARRHTRAPRVVLARADGSALRRAVTSLL